MRTNEMWERPRPRTLAANLLVCAVLAMASVLATATTVAHAAPQDGFDPTGSNFRIWGSPSFNRQIGPDDVVVQVAGGDGHTVALLADGSVACWGRNNFGQCTVPAGIGTSENPVAGVAAGSNHTVALLADGSLACWGSNGYGQCNVPSGIGTPENPVASMAAGGDMTVVALAVTSSPCPADLNHDGVVAGGDLGAMFVSWGPCANCPADLDGDGVVGGSDLGLIFIAWGACP